MTVTLITGCSSGIGQATALHLARRGHHVVATMRDPGRGARPLVSAAESEGLRLEVLPLDVTAPSSVDALFAQLRERELDVSVLVNNAGISRQGSVEETPDDDYRRVLETNFFGPVRMIRAVLPGMRVRGSGWIVNVSAMSGRMTFPLGAPYAASKHALEAMSEVLAQEVYEFGVKVILIEPGFVSTQFFSKSGPPPDPYSPYASHGSRHLRVRMRLLEQAEPPETVARAIERAISSREPPFRYLVGDDVEMLVGGRKRMTDEDWVAANQPMSLAEEDEFWREKFGFEI